MKYNALFIILKKWQNLNCSLLQNIGGTLRVNQSGLFRIVKHIILTDKRNASSEFKVMLYKCLYMMY